MEVRLEHLTKIFPSRDKKGSEVVAVNDFDFTIPEGKLIGLLGPSGCGKSTVLYMICGLEKPTFREARRRARFPELRIISAPYSKAEYHVPVREPERR